MPVATEEKTNRLINEKSPYLLQHAHNPVDWYPWGEEAFTVARNEDKPIFLSIGYSTCHWCHVMERESFENSEAAEVLNRVFVCIKLDREERPDIDHVYMEVCQAMTGGGGWPLSIFMDGDKRPFYTGTYFPRRQLIDLAEKIDDLWRNQRKSLADASQQIVRYLNTEKAVQNNEDNEVDLPEEAYEGLKAGFDPRYGGFYHAPKFPTPHQILFLMEWAKSAGRQDGMDMAIKTLDGMDRGGIHDHIGQGFCRYSTDQKWLVPHFEKMLYDNALLSIAYAKAAAATGNSRMADTAKSTLDYLLRVMRSPEGGFYTAEDADSEGVEGKFYVWSREEAATVLGDASDAYCSAFDITLRGNFEGKNIPNLIDYPTPLEEAPAFAQEREALFASREKRVHPFLDDKILTCWNGLAMAAFATAGRILGEEQYIRAAEENWSFLQHRLFDDNGGLLSAYREGVAKNPAHADDYAFLIWGLIELHAATFDLNVLAAACRLNRIFLRDFWDGQNGGFFFAGKESEILIARTKPVYDGATPSANSVAALNCIRLSAITGDLETENAAHAIFKTFGSEMKRAPAAYTNMMRAQIMDSAGVTKIVLAAKGKETLLALAKGIMNTDAFIETVLIDRSKEIPGELKEYFSAYMDEREDVTAFVCTGKTCLPPASGKEEIAALLARIKSGGMTD